MDPDVVRQLLRGEEDVLTPAIKAEEELYRNTRCPMCGEGGVKKRMRAPKVVTKPNGEPVVAVSPFGDGPLVEGYAHCINCGTDFNPQTGMIFKTEASLIHDVE